MNTIYLTTGNSHLDKLLAMDSVGASTRGIQCVLGDAKATPPVAPTVPIVLIHGAAGTGKTTLALQIASAVARLGTDRDVSDGGVLSTATDQTRVFYYSLEQTRESLITAGHNFGFFSETDQMLIDFETSDSAICGKRIHLCHFAPLPISERESETAFEDRFSQLCHMIAQVKSDPAITGGTGLPTPVFFLDSLNAIATSSLPRNDIYRLFAVFRSQGIPAIITAERADTSLPSSTPISDAARYLADVVIELTRKESAGHLLQYLEISKSRIRRQALGKHLYKIRTKTNSDGGHHGFLVYPSLPCIVSTSRSSAAPKNAEYWLCDKEDRQRKTDTSLFRLMQTETIKAGACFALIGPPGTHKLALGLNLATGYVLQPERKRRVLIISFGSYGRIDLSGVAWFNIRSKWTCCDSGPEQILQQKGWHADFRFSPTLETKHLQSHNGYKAYDDSGGLPQATQLNFRIGHLTPEECFDVIDQMTSTNRSSEGGCSSVVLQDTAQVSTGFPLLRQEPLFLASLIDLFRDKGLVSVVIGVREENSLSTDMDFALAGC